jgi:predicted nucleic acid-binding protein
MVYVIDSSAMIAMLRKEPGWDFVRDIIADPDNSCYAHALNLCEVFYDFMRAANETEAEQAIVDLFRVGVAERNDIDAVFWRQVSRLKAIHRKVSLADCFAIALVLRLGGELVTSDHHELDQIQAAGVCPIIFR